jgi:hypothetical protein
LLVGQIHGVRDAAVASSQCAFIDGRCAVALSGINGEVKIRVVSCSPGNKIAA